MVTNNLSEKYVGYVTGARRSTLQLAATVWHKFIGHKCLQQASSLAFNTLLCLVPLSAVALFLLKTFGAVEDDNSPLIVALRDNFLPRYAAEEIVSELSGFANRNLGGLGVGGFLLFLIVSTLLFISVEQHFNNIWGARHRLPIVQAFQKYAVFYTLLSIGPLLIWLFFSTATNWVFAHVFPWVLVYCVLFLMYIAMPNTFVKWHAALLGALVAGTLFQTARLAFGRYLEAVWQNYSDIYGALAILVVFAIWTYVAWVVVLLGAEVSNSVQHFRSTPFPRERFRSVGGTYLNASDVITLFLIVAEHFSKGRGACPPEQVASLSGISEDIVDQCLERFKAARLIYEVDGDTIGFLPARGLAEITLQQVVDAVEENIAGHLALDVSSAARERVLGDLRESQREHLEKVTVASLL
ncbi:YihY family inner membrane protein [Candidatus Poribacteria bacterium]|nr:YihY family inner membrane protein [Candidatus Poribacteria bacterium]MYK19576.1 YihY family inner membrane protein [Candidatus Poribacteria bacterium]